MTTSHRHEIENTAPTPYYARVEAKIADLDWAITLLGREECQSDAAFARRARVIAHQTLQSVRSLVPAPHPDSGQMARIASKIDELRACLLFLEDPDNVALDDTKGYFI